MTSGSARDLVRISWSERDLLKPVLAVLTVGGLVISTLASYAFGLAEGGDIGSLVTIGAIAIVCTLVVLRAVTRHAVAERWAMARRLRIIGMSARHLRLALLIETAALALVAALTGTVLTRYVVVPLLTPYLVSMDVVPAGTSARWRLNATLLTVLGTALVAFVGTFGASLTLTRVEPAGTAPPGRANGPHGALRMAAPARRACADGLHRAPAAGGDIHAFGRDGLPARRARPHLSDRPAVHGVEGRRCGLRQGGGPSPVAPGVRARAAVTTLARAPAPGDGHQRNSHRHHDVRLPGRLPGCD